MQPQQSLSVLIQACERGEDSAKEALFAELYAELHRIARRELGRHAALVTLSPTTLLHEAYLNISGREGTAFQDQAHFLGYAARAMRGLIIDHARNRKAQKRGGQFEITSMEASNGAVVDDRELVRLSDGLDELAKFEQALAEIVDLKFFCGFDFIEIAGMRGVSERTVLRQWKRARLFLHRAIAMDVSS
jgi:RNA polymerase sigma factor (TIGR02999 family)